MRANKEIIDPLKQNIKITQKFKVDAIIITQTRHTAKQKKNNGSKDITTEFKIDIVGSPLSK